MTEQWAIEARSNSMWQKPEEQQAITIIQSLLESKINPQAAAEKLASTYEARLKNGDTDLWWLWTAYFDAIDHLGTDMNNLERLVQMTRSVSQLPDVIDDRGRAIITASNAQTFWRDMPHFAFYFREVAMDAGDTIFRDQATWDAQSRKYTNGNVFAALYLRELDPHGPPRDLGSMKNLAQWNISVALELPIDTLERFQQTEIYVPPAALWILIAGRNVYECCKAKVNNTGDLVQQRWMGMYGGTLLWTGEEGFSIERWNFWKQRFSHISQLEGTERVVQLAAQAAEEMEKIDGENAC